MARLRRGGVALSRQDAGVADVLGTVLLLAATLVIIAAAVPLAMPSTTRQDAPPSLHVRAEGRAGDLSLTLTHVGGASWPRSDLRVVVAAGASTLADVSGGNGTFGLGDAMAVPLASPLPATGPVHVVVASRSAGTSLDEPPLLLLPPLVVPPPPVAPNVSADILDGTDLAILNRSAVFTLQASVAHPGGRLDIARVVANLTAVGGSPEVDMRDDGAGGDDVAGDGVWSLVVDVPLALNPGVAPLNVTAYTLDGATALDEADYVVLPQVTQVASYNSSLVAKFGWMVSKASTNQVNVALKLVTTGATVTINGLAYHLNKVYLEYQPIGGTKSETPFPASPCTLPVGLFTLSRLHVDHYKSTSMAFQYFFRLEWAGPSGSAKVYSDVEPPPPLQYFILRASEASQVVGTNWSSFTDCTTT